MKVRLRLFGIVLLLQGAVAPIVPEPSLADAFWDIAENVSSLSDLFNFSPAAHADAGAANPARLIPPSNRGLRQLPVAHQAPFAQASSSASPVSDTSSFARFFDIPQEHSIAGNALQQQLEHYHPSITQGGWAPYSHSQLLRQFMLGAPPLNIAPAQQRASQFAPVLDVPPVQARPWEAGSASEASSVRNIDEAPPLLRGRKGPHEEETSNQGSEPVDSSTDSDKLPKPRQGSRRLPQSRTTLQNVPIAADRLPNVEPLAVSGKPVAFMYQEDPLASVLVTQIKLELGMAKVLPAQGPRPLLGDSDHDFVKSMNYYFKTGHLFKEMVVLDRRFLVTVGGNIGRLSRTVPNQGLYVWEVKTDGERAIMVCRGSYTFERKFWKFLESETTVATKKAYVINTIGSTPTDSGIILIQSSDAESFAFHQDRMPWLNPAGKEAQSSPPKVSFSRIVYEPDPSLLPDFERFIQQTLGDRTRFILKPEVVIAENEKETFASVMAYSFKRRSMIRAVRLRGETYYMTFHRAIKPVGSLSRPFLALWKREQHGKEGLMKAVAVFPMTKNSFDLIVNRALLEAHATDFAAGNEDISFSRVGNLVEED